MDSTAHLPLLPDVTHISTTGLERRQAVRKKGIEPPTKPLNIQPLPRWITLSARGNKRPLTDKFARAHAACSDDAFAAGAALFALDQILRAEPVFLGVLRMRIALEAAVAASRLLRARCDGVGLRDTLYLTRAGDEPGLAGRAHLILRRFCERPTRLAGAVLDEIGGLGKNDGLNELLALTRADIALAERLGWVQPLPLYLLAIHDPAFRRGEEGQRIRIDEPAWEEMHHAILIRAAIKAYQLAVTLSSRAEKLIAAASILRTRDGEAGLAMILGDDCVAPWRMAREDSDASSWQGMSSDRAARRFCETLHAKRALRLLTPRPTFRLYGL